MTFHADSPTARTDDPDTSKDYGRGDPARNLTCARILLLLCWAQESGLTAAEATRALGREAQQNVVSRRLTDLVQLGLAERSPMTRPGDHGRRLTVFTVTAAGRNRLPAARRLIDAEWAVGA